MTFHDGFPCLVADIGGTHARFALVDAPGAPVRDVLKFNCAEHKTPQDAIAAYLDTLARTHGTRPQPRRAALAAATPIQGDTVKMTNSDWVLSKAQLREALHADEVRLLNDFEALSLALPALREDEADWIGPARPRPGLPLAVIGPGTGLGVGGCVPTRGGWVALAAEGGHVTACASDEFESEVLRLARREHGHLSAERLLSGVGLPLLHRAVCGVRGVPGETLTPAEITQRAIEAGDADAGATLDTFCAMLGTFAGNVALTLGARGGVFVAGGIAQRLGSRFTTSAFRASFDAKGRFETYMREIATGLITAPHAALTGAAQSLQSDAG